MQLVDPSAFTPPYDRALAAGLARAGAEVELLTSRFLYGPVPPAEGYRVDECFYRRSAARGLDVPARRAFKLIEHVPDMLRFRRDADADVVHYQWLTVPALDRFLLPAVRPRVMTAHYVLPPRPSRRQAASARAVFGTMDAVIAHSEHGAERLRTEVGLDPRRVRVIPHGAFDYLTRLPEEKPLPSELEGAEGPVILFFGLLRPYKGSRRPARGVPKRPGRGTLDRRQPAHGRRAAARDRRRCARAGPFRHALRRGRRDPGDLPPRRRAHPSLPRHRAVRRPLHGLAFGKPMVLTDVGGFGELAAQGAARVVPAADSSALAAALRELTGDEAASAELAEAAQRAAAGPYSWDETARRTLDLYEELSEASR